MSTYIYRNELVKGHKNSSNKLRSLLPGGHAATKVLISQMPNFEIEQNANILDFGFSVVPRWNRPDLKWFNKPENVKLSANRLEMLNCFRANNIPTFKWCLRKRDID